MADTTRRLAANRWNGLRDKMITRALYWRSMMIAELLVDGHPPGTVPLSPVDEYHRLVSMQMTNDPRFVNSPPAQQRLATLSLRYGRPPAFPQPLGEAVRNDPLAQARAAAFTPPAPPQGGMP